MNPLKRLAGVIRPAQVITSSDHHRPRYEKVEWGLPLMRGRTSAAQHQRRRKACTVRRLLPVRGLGRDGWLVR